MTFHYRQNHLETVLGLFVGHCQPPPLPWPPELSAAIPPHLLRLRNAAPWWWGNEAMSKKRYSARHVIRKRVKGLCVWNGCNEPRQEDPLHRMCTAHLRENADRSTALYYRRKALTSQ